MIAEGRIAHGLESALAEIDVARVRVSSIDELHAGVTIGGIACVWSTVGLERGFGRAAARLRSKAAFPIHALVRDDAPDAVARALYRAGVSGVFAWPREGLLLARYVAEMLSLRMVRGPTDDADKALARTIRAHLRHLPRTAGAPLDVQVGGGRAALRGTLESLADRDEIERRIAMVPGVTSLDVSPVRIEPVPVGDARLATTCRRLIANECDPETVRVSVQNGRVRFDGDAASAREVERLRELTARVQGVRDIELAIAVGRGSARRSRGTQRRLDALLRSLFVDAEFSLVCHGEIAVLEGRVPTLHLKRSMQRFVEQDGAVGRVVNKLRVEA